MNGQSIPSLYQDGRHVGEVSEWPGEQLERRINEYGAFLAQESLMPHARKTANRNLNHYLFELAYRDGVPNLVLLEHPVV